MDVIVEPLSTHPDLIGVVAGWHFAEWGHTDPGGTAAGWAEGLARQAGAGQPPGTLVAHAGGEPAAAVCLVPQDMPGYPPAAGLTPWNKGLYVVPASRRQGLGRLLVRRCEEWAASLGHAEVYLFTLTGSAAQALYRGLGWRDIHEGRYDGEDITIMRTDLPVSGR
ncbi:MAG: GNAT family N-acetyltransferase [Streptosporangiaceae bacterium]